MWHFLFDLDGTILDTTELILASFLHTFETALGQSVSREQVMVHFGRPLMEQFRLMRPDLSESDIQRVIGVYFEHNEAEHDGLVSLVPGADAGLRRLKAAGHPLGIVTSKRRALAVHGLKLFELDSLFSTVVALESTVQHKPHPEPVEHALHQMGGARETAVYVGDSPYDMTSGRAAGVRTLGLIHNTFSREDLTRAGADHVVDSWSEIADILLEWASQGKLKHHT